jgi:hypothetical protein
VTFHDRLLQAPTSSNAFYPVRRCITKTLPHLSSDIDMEQAFFPQKQPGLFRVQRSRQVSNAPPLDVSKQLSTTSLEDMLDSHDPLDPTTSAAHPLNIHTTDIKYACCLYHSIV